MSETHELSDFNPKADLFKFLLVVVAIGLLYAFLFAIGTKDADAAQIKYTHQQRATVMHATPEELSLQTESICKQSVADHKLIGEKMSAAAIAYCGL